MDRTTLRAALRVLAPWTTASDTGPAAVDAGECDRCGLQPRWIATCGAQPWAQICPDCVMALDTTAFCDGHHDDAVAHLEAACRLPDDWATITRLAWVATGEATPDDGWIRLVAHQVDDARLRQLLASS